MMNQLSNYKIYNASAGSGKTFNLVREYLIRIFSANSPLAFGDVLALTFTNKAVGEMKERILKMLTEFSEPSILENPSAMFDMLKVDLELSSEELQNKSKSTLRHVLHNYGSFDVSTIDKFNHRLIRTFSSDLKLPANFEVELDVDAVLSIAVDKLIHRAGEDEEITNLLLEYTFEKIDDDRSWDVSFDLIQIAKLLKNDGHRSFVEKLSNKSLDDFKILKRLLKNEILKAETNVVKTASDMLEVFRDHDLMAGVFNRNTLPNHFINIKELKISRSLYGNKLQQNLEANKSITLSKAPSSKIVIVDDLLPTILSTYIDLKKKVYRILFLKNALRQITPVSVLHEINNGLKDITAEEGILLISDFNKIINNEIKEQPAPYIYERMGERYKDYFIDEFQDTSEMQWQNLWPLIDNAVSQENLTGKQGSVMLVGDAKQSIYRWRGGKPEQFINLYKNRDLPFGIEANLFPLKDNYRSKKTIVEFNNSFFKFVASSLFSDELHKELFHESEQFSHTEEDGYVRIEFLPEVIDDRNIEFAQRTLGIINEAHADGFLLSDLCILTRTKNEGFFIANYLTEHDVPIISSETLLLSNSPQVNFIVSVLQALENSENYEAKTFILNYIYKNNVIIKDEHAFYTSHLSDNNKKFFGSLSEHGMNFSKDLNLTKPLYELVEHIIRCFKLNVESNAYLQFFLDEVFRFSQKSNHGVKDFLSFWDDKQDSLSIVSAAGTNAVEVMTIHKSKGLEFPIVIFPFASRDIYDAKQPMTWYPVNPEEFAGFDHLYVSLNEDLKGLDAEGEQIYLSHRYLQELDSINLLYVTLTRPVERLYILSEFDKSKNSHKEFTKFSQLFTSYLDTLGLYQEQQLIYELGRKLKNQKKSEKTNVVETINMVSTSREDLNLNIITKQGRLWDTEREDAIAKGNLMHHILSLVGYKDDLTNVFSKLEKAGEIDGGQLIILQQSVDEIINHTELSPYFSLPWVVLNEREIVTREGYLHRPDRIVINQGAAIIIDYKTGIPQKKHKEQIKFYADLLHQMNYKVLYSFLVYIGEEINIIKI